MSEATKESNRMDENRKRDLLDSIMNSAAVVAERMGEETVLGILQAHGSKTIEDLGVSEYEDVFGTLFQYEMDSKD